MCGSRALRGQSRGLDVAHGDDTGDRAEQPQHTGDDQLERAAAGQPLHTDHSTGNHSRQRASDQEPGQRAAIREAQSARLGAEVAERDPVERYEDEFEEADCG